VVKFKKKNDYLKE